MMSAFPKLFTAAAAAAFLAVSPVAAQQMGHPELDRFELEERVTPEHRATMGQTFRGLGTPPAEGVAADIQAGDIVPETAVRHPVPPEVTEVAPDVAGYEYVTLADGRTALVHPATGEIAMILD
jgi:hypothetical protein